MKNLASTTPMRANAGALQAAAEWLRRESPRKAASLYVSILSEAPDEFAALCGLGMCSARLGAGEEADALFSRAAKAASGSVAAHIGLGLVLCQCLRFEAAVKAFAQALDLDPNHAQAHFHIANALCRLGQESRAIPHFRNAIALQPRSADAHNNLGVALQALGRIEEALACYRKAAELDPRLAGAQVNLAQAHRNLGQLGSAAEHYRKALALNPDDPDLHNTLAGVLHRLGRHEEALAFGHRALALAPDRADAHFNVALILQMTGDVAAAVAHYRRAIALRPDFLQAWNNLGNALQQHRQFAEAVEAYGRALALKPNADAHHNRAKALQMLGRIEEALVHYEAARELAPERAGLNNDHAGALIALGRVSEAQAAFARAAQLAPRDLSIQLNLANYSRFTPGDARLPALERLARDESSLSQTDRIALNFALGKAYGDLGETELSFRRLLEANRLKRSHLLYEEEATLASFARIAEVFTPDLFAALRGGGQGSGAPVFVLGMPRSGTTLIEQILASHSRVRGAGETDAFARAIGQVLPAFPDMPEDLAAEAFGRLGAHYLEGLGEAPAGVARVIDKMPSNFFFVGLIHVALPNARIIHARRNPLDTCLSCFSLLFTEDQPYAYDLAELGRYYRAYAHLMDHWRRVLPPGVMIDVRYEDVVADLEGQTRRMLAHCGLDYEEACLDFHRNRRPVHTASVAQVRRPLYSDSVGRWRAYEAHLQPLIRELR